MRPELRGLPGHTASSGGARSWCSRTRLEIGRDSRGTTDTGGNPHKGNRPKQTQKRGAQKTPADYDELSLQTSTPLSE